VAGIVPNYSAFMKRNPTGPIICYPAIKKRSRAIREAIWEQADFAVKQLQKPEEQHLDLPSVRPSELADDLRAAGYTVSGGH
jgi:hypothetical protein